MERNGRRATAEDQQTTSGQCKPAFPSALYIYLHALSKNMASTANLACICTFISKVMYMASEVRLLSWYWVQLYMGNMQRDFVPLEERGDGNCDGKLAKSKCLSFRFHTQARANR